VGASGAGGAARSPTDEVIESALRYRVQAPMIDSAPEADIGIEGGSLARMPGLIREASDMQGVKEAQPARAVQGSPMHSPPDATGGPPPSTDPQDEG
jgi:hypothetical protein